MWGKQETVPYAEVKAGSKTLIEDMVYVAQQDWWLTMASAHAWHVMVHAAGENSEQYHHVCAAWYCTDNLPGAVAHNPVPAQ